MEQLALIESTEALPSPISQNSPAASDPGSPIDVDLDEDLNEDIEKNVEVLSPLASKEESPVASDHSAPPSFEVIPAI